jgi:hypothetical protein
MHPLINYGSQFPEQLIAQGKGTNFVAITKLEAPFRRNDGKLASFMLDYRWLTRDCEHERDENYVCVKGQEFTYWQGKEINLLLKKIKSEHEVNVFDFFKLL